MLDPPFRFSDSVIGFFGPWKSAKVETPSGRLNPRFRIHRFQAFLLVPFEVDMRLLRLGCRSCPHRSALTCFWIDLLRHARTRGTRISADGSARRPEGHRRWPSLLRTLSTLPV